MDAVILKNFFDTVRPGDRFFYLGDLSFHTDTIKRVLNSLAGTNIKSVFLVGNHDNYNGDVRQVARSADVEIVDGFLNINIEGQAITLCHYALQSFYKSHFGAWGLYGHHHSDVSQVVTGKRMNVGVDHHNFFPVSFDQVRIYMKNRPDNWDTIQDVEKRF